MSKEKDKPVISELEAKWNIHLAGLKAEKEARDSGTPESETDTLLDAATGGIVIAGVKFPPVHAAWTLLLAKVNKHAKSNPALEDEFGNLAALAFILHSPDLASPMLRSADTVDLFVDAVTDFAQLFTIDQLREVVTWVAAEMTRLKYAGEAAGKSTAE